MLLRLDDASRRVAWPLSSGSALRLVDALLAAPAEAGEQLAPLLASDPALALWACCRAEAWNAKAARSVEGLAGWLAPRLLMELGGSLRAGRRSRVEETMLESAAHLAGRAVRIAHLAQAIALDEAKELADEAYLAGLLHQAEQWIALSARGRRRRNTRSLAPAWLRDVLTAIDEERESPAVARFVAQAIEILSAAGKPPKRLTAASARGRRAAAQARRRWRKPAAQSSLVARRLTTLVEKLARLDALESNFQETLECEKLEAMAELAAGAGHEMNNPLAVISGRAQLMLRGEQDAERRRDFALIKTQAMRVHEMIADMMLFARPPEPRVEVVDLGELVARVVGSLTKKAAADDKTLAVARSDESRPDESLTVAADPVQLAVALRALCDNALNAVEPRGRVEVSFRRRPASEADAANNPAHPGHAEITVSDDGPGVAPEIRRHLFDPFFSGRQSGRGLGMGLAKCWRIVRQHGGDLRAEARSGGGSVFHLRLPLASQAAPAPEASP